MSTNDENTYEQEYGECCYCNEPCNINSQCCGRCARSGMVYLAQFVELDDNHPTENFEDE